MVADMSYSTVSQVIESWEKIRRTENYEEKVGTRLFQRCVAMMDMGLVIVIECQCDSAILQ